MGLRGGRKGRILKVNIHKIELLKAQNDTEKKSVFSKSIKLHVQCI